MKWQALILAGSRGPQDPLARHYGLLHKCLLPVGGVPMLWRVAAALDAEPRIRRVSVCIEDASLLPKSLGFVQASTSAAASALQGVAKTGLPVIITTGDHALLTVSMVTDFLNASEAADADITVGLARAETILEAFPQAKRTFLKFRRDRVSGCNLYALKTERALKALEFWQQVEANRKSPFRLMRAFGLQLLAAWALGMLNLDQAFALASRRLGLVAKPVLMAQAEAAVDVDKPADKELAEAILAKRGA